MIFVKVKAGARENKVIPPPLRLLERGEQEKEYFAVSVKEPPTQGKANEAILKILAKHFSVPLSEIRLVRGASSKIKVFDIKGL